MEAYIGPDSEDAVRPTVAPPKKVEAALRAEFEETAVGDAFVAALKRQIGKPEQQETLAEAWENLDKPETPADQATTKGIHASLARAEAMLAKLDSKPSLVTICRSCKDGFTPEERVKELEKAAIAMVQRLYGQIDTHDAIAELDLREEDSDD